jgi:hypothetical protein
MFASEFFDVVGDDVLRDEGYAGMRSYSEIKGGISNPKVSKAFSCNCLAHCVEDVLVRKGSIWKFLHLLKLGLCVIKR